MTSSNTATGSLAKQVVLPDTADAHKDTGHKCQAILEHLHNSCHGYKACAEDCKDVVLKKVFQTVAKIRSDFIGDLSNVVRSEFGLEPVTTGSGVAVGHQTWIDVKAWFSDGRGKAAIATEMHRSEAQLIHHYEEALSQAEHLTDKVRHVLQEQLKTIREQDASVTVL